MAIKKIFYEIIYIFTNYFVCNIPIWQIRKIFYTMLGVKIGKGARILMKTKIEIPWRLRIGDYSIINENCYIDARGKIDIGSNVTIAVYSKLITGYHDIDSDNFEYIEDKILINNNVVIFSNCVVLAGANLDKGCVIAASSTVRRGNYKEKGVYAGNPIKYIRDRKANIDYVQNSWMPWFR